MAHYVVTFSAIEQIPIVVDSEHEARIMARRKLDPNIDWDCDTCDDVTDKPEYDWMFEDL